MAASGGTSRNEWCLISQGVSGCANQGATPAGDRPLVLTEGAERWSVVSDLARVLALPLDEAEIMTELRSGSEAAFDWLVTYYHGPVYAVIFGILRNPSDAADVTQEVFLKAFRGIRTFRHGSSLKTWLYRIAVRESLNYKRWFWRHLRFQR